MFYNLLMFTRCAQFFIIPSLIVHPFSSGRASNSSVMLRSWSDKKSNSSSSARTDRHSLAGKRSKGFVPPYPYPDLTLHGVSALPHANRKAAGSRGSGSRPASSAALHNSYYRRESFSGRRMPVEVIRHEDFEPCCYHHPEIELEYDDEFTPPLPPRAEPIYQSLDSSTYGTEVTEKKKNVEEYFYQEEYYDRPEDLAPELPPKQRKRGGWTIPFYEKAGDNTPDQVARVETFNGSFPSRPPLHVQVVKQDKFIYR